MKFRKMTVDDMEMVREWRMRPDITRYMYTDPIISMEEQIKWYNKISDDDDIFYWIVEKDGKPIGLACLCNWDKNNNRIDTGSYIVVKDKDTMRIAIDLQWNLYWYAFEVLKVNKVCEEVMADNTGVLHNLDLCGSKTDGVLRQHILKNGNYHDIVVRSVCRSDWTKLKERIEKHLCLIEER